MKEAFYSFAIISIFLTVVNGETETRCNADQFLKNGTSCMPCILGYWSIANSNKCYICPHHHYCLADGKGPIRCPAFYFTKNQGTNSSLSCINCPQGYRCPSETIIRKCSKGYNSKEGEIDCFKRNEQRNKIDYSIKEVEKQTNESKILEEDPTDAKEREALFDDPWISDSILRGAYEKLIDELTATFGHPSLLKVKIILKDIGEPQHQYKTVYITGTNGKGSVAVKVASILQAAGYKTGLYTSPHCYSFRERIQIDGRLISKEDFLIQYRFIKDKAKQLLKNRSYTREILSCMAFSIFADNKVDIAVIEAGKGVKKDHTNVLIPEVSVITNVDLDHVGVLGNNVVEIAENKAHAIKQGRPAVIGTHLPLEVFQKVANEQNSELHIVEPDSVNYTFDELNSKMAKKVCEVLNTRGFNISLEAMLTGAKITLPGRMQLIPNKYLKQFNLKKYPQAFYLDVGHNMFAWKQIQLQLERNHPGCKIRVVKMLEGKDKYGKYANLKEYFKMYDFMHFYKITAPTGLKAQTAYDLATKVKEELIDEGFTVKTTIEKLTPTTRQKETIKNALKKSSENEDEEVIVFFGFYGVGILLKWFGYDIYYAGIYA